jgi:hypothetical protein
MIILEPVTQGGDAYTAAYPWALLFNAFGVMI